jgi:MYXO-CTERM domain-containing protein
MSVPVMMTIDGDVVAIHSYWTRDASRIVTKATVRTPTGEDVVVTQLGGSVDGIGQITMPGPPLLRLGMKVAIGAHRGFDLSNREHVVLDSVKVLAYPPDFVRTGPTKAGNYLSWESGCVFITPDSAGTTGIPGDQEFAIIDAAIAEWNTKTSSCSYLSLRTEARQAVDVGNDKVNAIKFRDTACECMDAEGNLFMSWCRPATDDEPQSCHNTGAAGLTTATYVDDSRSMRDGAIIDADIELNNVDFAITVEPQPGNPRNAVLQNTLTHELGHLLGLEHPCLSFGDPPRIDGDGNNAPSCVLASGDPNITEATMFPTQTSGETKKATLSDDDIAAVCRIYPSADDPGQCLKVGETAGCCSASGPSGRPDIAMLLAGLAALFLFRRRRTSPVA